jgi:hypothetical protein
MARKLLLSKLYLFSFAVNGGNPFEKRRDKKIILR